MNDKDSKIIMFKSPPRQTAFAPEWEYIFFESIIDDVDFDKISNIVLQRESELIHQFPAEYILKNANKISYDGDTELGINSLTARYLFYNLFSWEEAEVQRLKQSLLQKYIAFLKLVNVERRNVWIQCWANVMRNGEQIKPHIHSTDPYTYLGGHITVQTSDTTTDYINPINQIRNPQEYKSENVPGKVTLFQNNIPHYTSVYSGDSERITIAFDLIVDEDYVTRPDIEKRNMIKFDFVD